MKTACKSREMLRGRLRTDMKVYRDAVEALEAAALKGTPKREFEKLANQATRAQEAFRLARERLHKHITEHGCG